MSPIDVWYIALQVSHKSFLNAVFPKAAHATATSLSSIILSVGCCRMTKAVGALTDIALRILSFSALVVNPAHAVLFSAM